MLYCLSRLKVSQHPSRLPYTSTLFISIIHITLLSARLSDEIEVIWQFFSFAKLHGFARWSSFTCTTLLPSTQSLCSCGSSLTKHATSVSHRIAALCGGRRGSGCWTRSQVWESTRTLSIASWIVLHWSWDGLGWRILSCIVCWRDALHWIILWHWIVGLCSSFSSKFFLDALWLLSGLILSNFLLLFVDSLICRVHLKIGL